MTPVTDQEEKATKVVYDMVGNVTAITYPDGTKVTYEYDLNDNLIKVTDREGLETIYVYDAINRVTEIHRPNGISTYNTYNARNQITELVNVCDDCEWVVSSYTYTYDNRGYIVAETAIESLAGYAYDDKHNGKHTDGRHDDKYPHGTKHTKHDKDATFAYQIVQTDRTFTYDDAGKLLSSTETEDNYGTYVYTYEYDLMGNRTSVTKTAEDGTVAEWHKYEYNDSNQLVAEELYNGKKTTSLRYEYDADGNRISETGKIGTDKVQLTYEYTVENRLQAVYDADELLVAMAYDGDGNRVFQLNYNLHTDEDWKGNSGNGNGNNKDNKGSGNNGKGNSKSTGTDDAGYGNATNAEEHNSQNQSGILFPTEGEVSDTEQSLIDKIKTEGKQKDYELIEYINDVNREYTEVLVEQNINGKLDTAYVYGNERLSLDRFDGSTGYYLYDPRGSVTGITNEEGQIYQSYRYDAFGKITFGAPTYENEYTYNGESYNPNIESQYLRARYYDVVNGGFLTEDSYLGNINEPLTLNRYNYCISNPLSYRDPSGKSIENEIAKSVISDSSIDARGKSKEIERRIEIYRTLTGIDFSDYWNGGIERLFRPTLDEMNYLQAQNSNALQNQISNGCSSQIPEYVTLKQLKNNTVEWEFREIVSYDVATSLPTYKDAVNGREITQDDVDEINRVLDKYNINTPERIQHFLAQCFAETDGGYIPVEQFSGDVFTYFQKYESNNNKLGNTQKGDGAKYRGAGGLQITGREVYEEFSIYMNDTKILDDGALYVGKEYFWESAAYYWTIYKPSTANDDRYDLNKKIDAGATVKDITLIINGGNNELVKRQNAYNYYANIIK